jgi:predicted glycosyl hydrolase (DUF1957 family)
MSYPFSLVLHTHLPMVVNHGRWPHGSDWLNEATFECYLPLLETAHRLVAEGLSPKWTVNISPVLTEQLASPEFQKELSFYYENVRRACVESRDYFTAQGDQQIVGLTYFWEEFYERMWELHRRIGGDIPGTFAELQRGGHLELITCGATHGYLPLLSRDESIHLQLRAAVETHTRHFGKAPRGIWLPECAYRPRYEWTAPAGPDRERRMRPGIEEMLAQHGLEYFIADSHLVAAGEPVFLYRDFIGLRGELGEATSPMPAVEPRSPYEPYRVASRGGKGGMVCSPYDAELFGHWWFEGPLWLEHVVREMSRNGVRPMTLGEALQVVPPQGPLQLPEGSWGEGGDHRVWLNRDTEWTWDRVYSAEREWVDHLKAGDGGDAELKRVISQASRELMLLQASDWQFLITTGAARDYAERRVAEHYAGFKRLSEMAHTLRQGQPLSIEAADTLRRLEREDFVFPNLDPSWAKSPTT